MRKSSILVAALVLGASSFVLSGCDDNTPKVSQFTPEQQLRLAEIKSQERVAIETARMQAAANNPQLQQEMRQYNETPEVYVDNVHNTGSGNVDNGSSSSVGSHLLATGVGAVGGYMAGKAMSKPENQQKAQEYKRKAYTQYRFAKSKASSKYRSFKKRK